MKFLFFMMIFFASCGSGSKSGSKADNKDIKSLKFNNETIKKLENIKVDGFQKVGKTNFIGNMETSYYKGTKTNSKGRYPFASVTVGGCIACKSQPMKLEVWKNNKYINKKGSIVELIDIDNVKAIGIYSLSFVKKGKATVAGNSFTLHFNNGVNQIVIKLSNRANRFVVAKSLEELKSFYSKAEYINDAKTILHAFKPYL